MSSRKVIVSSGDSKESNGKNQIKVIDRPAFILKTREGENRAVSPSQKNGQKKESENQSQVSLKLTDSKILLSNCPQMTHSIKFIDENMQLCDNVLEYLCDQQDFMVIGCVGTQGVGKSRIMSLLASGPDIFPEQNLSHQESGQHCTAGIDIYVTKQRVIYLDTQPILSGTSLDHFISFDQKKNSDFVVNDGNIELQSLQFLAFLLSVCHVMIFVQDWFVDPNLLRFLQAAEMLKPASATSMDQDFVEYYPHVLFLHNKASMQDFMPKNIEIMKNFYKKIFISSRLQTHSGLDMGCSLLEGQLNFFLIPSIVKDSELMFQEDEKLLIEKLRRKIYGVTRNAITPLTLTEKTWFHYVSKVLEAIKKSHLSSEYGRLMP